MKLAISFTNFGPYHLARLRALAAKLNARGDALIAYEIAGNERRYPWLRNVSEEPFHWTTLFPDRVLESLARKSCRRAMIDALDRDDPDVLAIVGYSRPESMAMLGWARLNRRPTVLMSETQEIDHPRLWWKEAVKRQRVRRFSSALVGGPKHADYLRTLGLRADRIALGYNAVDNDHFARIANQARRDPNGRLGLPTAPYFIAVSRFVPEKNLVALVEAYARYRGSTQAPPWDLVVCGDGESRREIEASIRSSGFADSIHLPGFLQTEPLTKWLAHASAFVHPSLMEPWGLAANEAAACGLPLLISDRAGCSETLVPNPAGTTGWRFDPTSVSEIAEGLGRLAAMSDADRVAMGRRSFEVVSQWGPARFASGTLEAIELALDHKARKERRLVPLRPSPELVS